MVTDPAKLRSNSSAAIVGFLRLLQRLGLRVGWVAWSGAVMGGCPARTALYPVAAKARPNLVAEWFSVVILDPCALSGCVPAKNGLAKYQLGLETASAWPAQGGVASKHGPRHFFRGLTHRQLSECEADDAAHGHVPASLK
jgi:hypothetical protein